jgi:ketosteroid isomerase-like protein
MNTTRCIVVSVLCLATGVGFSAAGSGDVRQQIAAQARALTEAINAADPVAAARCFTTDAKILVAGSNGFVAGRDAVEKFWRSAIAGGVTNLALTPTDFEGTGELRIESGRYAARGAGGVSLGSGDYLLVWKREAGQWRIHRDVAHATPQPQPQAGNATQTPAPDFPADYDTTYTQLGSSLGDEEPVLHTAYANAVAAAVTNLEELPYPDGSVILMEFARSVRDGEGQLLRNRDGSPMKGEIVRVDVMRRGAGLGAQYGDQNAGDWEFSSYRRDGTRVLAPADAGKCAACHRNAGAASDHVFRMKMPDVK